MIEFKDVHHAYRTDQGLIPVLEGISFRITPGEKVVLLGINGCGKSTLLKLMNGLMPVQRGELRFHDQTLTAQTLKDRALIRDFRSKVVLLFQNPEVMLFHPTVYDEIAFGPRQQQLGQSEVDRRVRHWARIFGLEKQLDRLPLELSGGEKKKLCLASLLILEPEVLLLDEPTANLDPRTVAWLVDFLSGLSVTLLVSTHNLSLAPELGGRALALSDEHRLVFDGRTPELLQNHELLQKAGLIHTHRHAHSGTAHTHPHSHDWD